MCAQSYTFNHSPCRRRLTRTGLASLTCETFTPLLSAPPSPLTSTLFLLARLREDFPAHGETIKYVLPLRREDTGLCASAEDTSETSAAYADTEASLPARRPRFLPLLEEKVEITGQMAVSRGRGGCSKVPPRHNGHSQAPSGYMTKINIDSKMQNRRYKKL